ncbi:MAG: cis-2,3-dihydrobiphenyl-2,3-diol dehydrogenase [Thalassospira sp. Nap_22]|nr:MAG: cis-2,3-dihydrobiphenyl-2,3-diol dehydrogenase [Thalassospira sp. Nap_22]
MGWLKESVALITGGGSGLGLSLVKRYLAEGAKVAVLEADEQRAEQLRETLQDQVCVIVGDVTRYDDNERAVKQTVDTFGRLDVFVANAGIFDFFEPLAAYEGAKLAEAFDELMSVNAKGGVLGARAALPELIKTQGNIIFTISNAGFYPGGGGPLYTASKHALVGIVRQLAYELAPKVRVNGVAPGGMKTGLRGLSATGTDGQSLNQIDTLDELLTDITPLQVSPQPEDYCGPYVLLASKENSSVTTGVIINTDGGLGVRGIANVRGGENL